LHKRANTGQLFKALEGAVNTPFTPSQQGFLVYLIRQQAILIWRRSPAAQASCPRIAGQPEANNDGSRQGEQAFILHPSSGSEVNTARLHHGRRKGEHQSLHPSSPFVLPHV
jgi:hypothetical protein